MDSSWEVALAKRLDQLNIMWVRPGPIVYWSPSSKKYRRYFPDFYLPEMRVYVDPKNDWVASMQATKIKEIREHGVQVVILSSLEEVKSYDPRLEYSRGI